MGVRLALHLSAAALLANAAHAAVATATAKTAGECRVAGAERLPQGLDRNSVCTAIRQALAQQGVRAPYAVDIEIKSSSRVAASLTLNGRALPRQSLAVSDDQLTLASIRQLAKALAATAAK
jgi:metal-dependent HD superfamily phosphatase/phosphodiesterase